MDPDPHCHDADPQPCSWICLLNLFCDVFRWNSSHDDQRVMSGKKGPVKPVFFSPGQSVVEVDTCSSASALGRPSPPSSLLLPPLFLPYPLSSPPPPPSSPAPPSPDEFPRKLKPSLRKMIDGTSVPDTDPRAFWPPGSGSGSTSQRYGSRSGSFYHHAKIIRKISNPTILWLFLIFYHWKIM
jgi:hypothetical protein